MERAPFLPRPPHRPVWVNNRGRLLEGSCQVGTRLLSLFSCFYHPVVLLLAVSEPTRTWVFMVLDVVSRTETHQSLIRIKTREVSCATRPAVPGTTCPRKPSVPDWCPSRRSTNRVAALGPSSSQTSANPFVAHRRGDSVPPARGSRIRGWALPIKSHGYEPTPFPAHAPPHPFPRQAKARVTSKATSSRMR